MCAHRKRYLEGKIYVVVCDLYWHINKLASIQASVCVCVQSKPTSHTEIREERLLKRGNSGGQRRNASSAFFFYTVL